MCSSPWGATDHTALKVRPVPKKIQEVEEKPKEDAPRPCPTLQGLEEGEEQGVNRGLGLALGEKLPHEDEAFECGLDPFHLPLDAGEGPQKVRLLEERELPTGVVDDLHPVGQVQVRPALHGEPAGPLR